MKLKKINFIGILIILSVALLMVSVGFQKLVFQPAKELYLVYLDGAKIGLLDDEQALFDLIDNQQKSIKNEFGVERVYPPSGLKTIKYMTYSNNYKSANEIYDKIAAESTFTILGYTVTIKPDEGDVIVINILNKEDLEPALLDAVGAFIDPEKLSSFMKDTQSEITDTGKIIENVYFQEKITIKENYIPVDETIISNKSDLTKYLLFGTLEKQDEYIVKDGDTVETVAYDNKLSNGELLIANPDLPSVHALLKSGQVLNIGLINPLFHIVEESYEVSDEPKKFDTVYEEDSSKYASETYVKQEGVNGIRRTSATIQYVNGDRTQVSGSTETEVLKPIDRIIVKGTKKTSSYSYYSNYPPAITDTDWGWPTVSGYIITSQFGYRWGRLHGGIDISGGRFEGSPVYSATDGTVEVVNTSCPNNGYLGNPCGGQLGNYVQIKTPTGMTVFYAHMRNNIQVSVGQTVSKGQLIGSLGNSGSSTGPHLHFEIRDVNGTKVNPCSKELYGC